MKKDFANFRPRTTFSAILVTSFIVTAAPSLTVHAESALKIEPTDKAAKRRANEAVEGYYKALIAKDYDAAGSFVHPDFVAPLQRGLKLELEKSANEKSKKATFEELGVADQTELNALTAGQFFAKFARSKYGSTVQAIGDPKIEAKVTIGAVRCNNDDTACDVDIVISVFDAPTKKRNERETTVRAQLDAGRWLVGGKPAAPKPAEKDANGAAQKAAPRPKAPPGTH